MARGAGRGTRSTAFLPDGSKAYVTCETTGVVCVVDVAANEVLKEIRPEPGNPLLRPTGVVVSPDGGTICTANGPSDDVSVIDVRELSEVARIKAGRSRWGIAVGR